MFSDSTTYSPSDGGDEIAGHSVITDTEEEEIERLEETARKQQEESN